MLNNSRGYRQADRHRRWDSEALPDSRHKRGLGDGKSGSAARWGGRVAVPQSILRRVSASEDL